MQTIMYIMECIFTFATLLIAVVNLYFVYHFHKKNKESDEDREEKNRRINLLKTLVLDYNMIYLYEFFDNCDNKCRGLKIKGLNDSQKKLINDSLISFERKFENQFLSLLIGINDELYLSIKDLIDNMIDNFTNSIFDPGINLYVEEKYNDIIYNSIISTKKDVISVLFNYKGD